MMNLNTATQRYYFKNSFYSNKGCNLFTFIDGIVGKVLERITKIIHHTRHLLQIAENEWYLIMIIVETLYL